VNYELSIGKVIRV